MLITRDQLTAYLEQSKDWLLASDGRQWNTYDGPAAADGHPVQIVLPAPSSTPPSTLYITTAIATLAKSQNVSTATMIDRITPTSVPALLDAIKHFDSEPGVFKVQLTAAAHLAGYDAYLDFRRQADREHGGLAAHADTPAKALKSLLATLTDKWGPCPACGHPLAGKPVREATS